MSTAAVGLPAYSGPDGHCPRCDVPGAMTEWHWASPLASPDMAGRTPPCAGRRELADAGGRGEHLCRVCLNCGYGWPEACTGHDAPVPRQVPPLSPALCAGLSSLAGAVASAGAGSLLRLLLGGTALAVAWLAVTIAISAIAAIGYAVAADRGAWNVTVERTGKGYRQ